VQTFLRVRTWLALDDPEGAAALARDAAALARLEGLEGHARSAERRADSCADERVGPCSKRAGVDR
jgi:histidinol dehydrogenase